jgi:hemerythrin
MNDPIRDLAHDHADLNHRVLAIAALLREVPENVHDEVHLALSELRDQLFLHFAREEEGVFPFIAHALPQLAQQVDQMTSAHDTICGALARTCHLAERDGDVATLASLFERFQVAYADHASAEALLLRSLDRRLDAQQRDQLFTLVAGI